MPLSERFAIDFDRYAKNLVEQALGRMLSQHYDKCVLRQFAAAFAEECQELYAACLDLQKQRTPYYAEGENLDALGRIVGEPRSPWQYDDSFYLFYDRHGQSFDQGIVWCIGAPLGGNFTVDDLQYRTNIIVQAIKNHTLAASVPEIIDFMELALGTAASFEKTGPNEVKLIVPSNTSSAQLYRLIYTWSDGRVDDGYWMPYPATLSFSGAVMFVPNNFFMFDVQDRGFDVTAMGVGVNQWELLTY